MLRYILKRILIGVLSLADSHADILSTSYAWGPFTREKVLPEAISKNLNARYHLDDPL